MSKITTVELVDDITGEADETVRTIPINFDGMSYEVDLNKDNLLALFDALEPFLNAGTLVKQGKNSSRSKSAKGGSKGDTKEIRAWAQKNYDGIGERGRIPKEIVEAYRAQVAA